jgi:type IV secretory pathway component VirB8
MIENRLEGSHILAITDGNTERHIEFINEYKQKESSLKLKYYMWLSRFFIFLAVLSLSFFWSASLSLFRLAPQVTVKPFLIISQDNSEDLVRVESIDLNMASKDKIAEMFVRQYVEMRNTIIDDITEMRIRWFPGGIVNFLSAPRIFNEFTSQTESIWPEIGRGELIQEVEIINVQRVGGQHSPIWKVDFKTYNLEPLGKNNTSLDRTITSKYWTASITGIFIRERIFTGRRLINPMGFTVLRYSQTRVEGI